MPGKVISMHVAFGFLSVEGLFEPLLEQRMVDIVVIAPILVTGIVRWIDVDAFDSPFVLRKECLECIEIVPMDDHVLGTIVLLVLTVLVIRVDSFQGTIRDRPVMVDDLLLSDPIQYRHATLTDKILIKQIANMSIPDNHEPSVSLSSSG